MAQFLLNPLTLSNISRFSKSFHCQNQEKICNNIITKDPTTPQVCRYTTLWNVSVLTATIENKTTSLITHFKKVTTRNSVFTVNMFSVAVYYLTSVQDASATPGPCSRTAHRHGHTLLGTHWRTLNSSSLTCGLQQPGLESSRLRCFGCPSADGLSTSTIHDNQPAKAGDRHWVRQTVAAFHSPPCDESSMHHRHELELHSFPFRTGTSSQLRSTCISCFRPRSNFLVSLARRAAAFKRRCNLSVVAFGAPASSTLQ